jgi:hypothetical protein
LNVLGEYAFYKTECEEVSFPEGLTEIGDCAFLEARKLTLEEDSL